MPVRAIVFDFGNVIAFFDHQKACRQLAALSTASLDAHDVHRAVFETRIETDYDAGRISTPQFLDALRRALSLEATNEQIDRAWSDIFTPNASMRVALPQLKQRGLRFILGSNTNELHHQWFGRLFADTLAAFDHQVVSYRVGHRKPDARFYEACIAAAGCDPTECLYIDDRADLVDAARALGIPSFVYSADMDVVAAVDEATSRR